MRATLDHEDDDFEDDDEEQILYPQLSPSPLRHSASSPTQQFPLLSSPNAFPGALSSAASPRSKMIPITTSTTAEDLLQRVLGGGAPQLPLTAIPNHSRRLSIPYGPSLLFGASVPSAGGNIWASPPSERISPLGGPSTPSHSSAFSINAQRSTSHSHQRQFSSSQPPAGPWMTPTSSQKTFPSSPPLSPHAPVFSPPPVMAANHLSQQQQQRALPPPHYQQQQQYYNHAAQVPQPLTYQASSPYFATFAGAAAPQHRPWA